MKIASKISIYILGLIIGTILVAVGLINISNPVVKHVDYTEEEIKEKARELGMIDIKENIEANMREVDSIGNDNLENNSKSENTTNESNNIEKILEDEFQNNDSESKKNLDSIDEEIDEEKEYIDFRIKKGEDSNIVIRRLYEKEIIDDIDEFVDQVRKRGAARKIVYGKFKLEKDMSYDNIIDILIGKS